MTLHPELQTAVDNAKQGDLRGLHQAILGPERSGKTTQAHDYATALAAKTGISKMLQRDVRDLKFVGSAAQMFADAKGGALILDELEKADATLRREILSYAVRAISDNDTLIIITGAISLENDIAMDEGLKRRMNEPIMLDRSFTQAEMTAYNAAEAAKHAARDEEHRKVAMRAERLAEWKAAKNEDLRPHQSHAAPKTARFRKHRVTQ